MFDWDDANREHVRRHGVEPSEAEEAMADVAQVPLGHRWIGGELRGSIIGKTTANRIIQAIYTMRADRYRVVTAWPANRTHRRRYRDANQ